MVKIINGEIVEDHDPRARSLMQAQHNFMLMQQQQLQQQLEQQHQQQQQQPLQQHPPQAPYYQYSPYGYYPQYAYPPPPAAHPFPHEYPHYYSQHHSPFASYETDSDPTINNIDTAAEAQPAPTHLAPPSPAPAAHLSPALTHRRLSFSSNPSNGAPSPSLPGRRLSLSSHAPQLGPISTPPGPTRRLSLSSASVPSFAHSPSQPPSAAPPASSAAAASQLYPRRHPSSYNLFGLPSITIAEIQVRPHVYLLAATLLYFIGPPVLVPLLASFFFYRWHLAREEDQKEKERLELKFSAFRYAKTRPRGVDSGGGPRIHSLRDIQS